MSHWFLHPQLECKDGPIWFNHHRQMFRPMFRAAGPRARLVLADWASPAGAGEPAGHELMFHYVQVEPYFEPNPQ